MKIPATITSTGAYVPILINSRELKTRRPILFLIDTGAYKSAISALDIFNYIDLSKLTKDSRFVFGIGGSQESYLIHNATFYFLSDTDKWLESKRLKTLTVVPFVYNAQSNSRLRIPSIIGLDIIGKNFSLYYGKDQVFLESL